MSNLKLSVKELIIGKPYLCYLSENNSHYDLSWGNSRTQIQSAEISKKFIFLGLAQDVDYVSTIKGLVNGKILYAPGVYRDDFSFEEMK